MDVTLNTQNIITIVGILGSFAVLIFKTSSIFSYLKENTEKNTKKLDSIAEQLAEIKEENISDKKDIIALQKDITEIKKDVHVEIKNDIQSIKERISKVEFAVDNLRTKKS